MCNLLVGDNRDITQKVIIHLQQDSDYICGHVKLFDQLPDNIKYFCKQ